MQHSYLELVAVSGYHQQSYIKISTKVSSFNFLLMGFTCKYSMEQVQLSYSFGIRVYQKYICGTEFLAKQQNVKFQRSFCYILKKYTIQWTARIKR